MKRLSPILVSLAVLVVLPNAATAGSGPGVAQHQQSELANLNAARWNPPAWGAERGIDLDDVLPRPPLAVNPNLTDSANLKANEVSETGLGKNHRSLLPPYLWPNELAILAGYDLNPALGVESNTIEVLYAGAMEPVFAFLSPGGIQVHRPILLIWEDRLEIGVGLSDADNWWVFHVAYRGVGDRFVTGTVFDDVNGNGFMDAGEGLAGVTVTAGSRTTVTNGGGGYSIEVNDRKYRITASGAGFNGTSTTKILVDGFNVGADFISGSTEPVVRDYQLCKGKAPTILGTSGDDVIYGTSGPDVIHGLAGNDTIYGLGGNDLICGGDGNDTLRGGGGKDRLYGSAGKDRLYGSGGDDRLYGLAGNDRLKGGMGTDTLDGGAATDICRTGEILIGCDI